MSDRFGPNTALVNAFIERLKTSSPKIHALSTEKMAINKLWEAEGAWGTLNSLFSPYGREWEEQDEIEAALVDAGVCTEPALWAAVALANKHQAGHTDFSERDFDTLYAPYQGEIPFESLEQVAA